jgi:hypothetical protein
MDIVVEKFITKNKGRMLFEYFFLLFIVQFFIK